MKLPNFLIIGVQKAGTTSIYNYLKQHPQVYMSPVKETNFLEQDWEQRFKDGSRTPNAKKIDTFEKYCNLFKGVKDEIAIGEDSPNYLFHYDTSIELIKRYVPQAKLIAVLRNPIERAHSDYLMHVRDAIGEKHKTLLEQVQYSAHKSFVLRKGFYGAHLQHFYDNFDREQIQVYLYDDLCKDAVKFMQGMYQFIGADPAFTPDVSKKAQTAAVPKNQFVNKLLRKQNPLRVAVGSTLKLFLPEEKRQEIRSNLIRLNSGDKSNATLSSEERQALVNLYREDILQLQGLIDRDLSAWLKV
ncbi:MAG: sulfotransferase [Cyanobacteriota bacterium]|nr:sulfotransferase [Cyanobacteriota bacterium]